MAGTLIVSNLTTDTDNTFIVRSNTGTTLFSANTTGIDVANSIGATAITNDKILSVANTKITGNIISSQITSVANTQLTGTITGSQISSNTLSNTVFQTGSVENYMSAAGLGFGMRNRIINGAMVIDQRNAGASVTITTDNTFTLDRWSTAATAASKFSVQQSTTAATGFTNSLLATSLTAYSVAAGDIFALKHTIEGFNVSDLGFGAAGASTVTVSFWVRSSLTGTFGGALQNGAQNRSYPFSFTINAANTFEYKTVTIAGDTSGTWLTNNGKGLLLWFSLGTGTTYSGTAGAWSGSTFYSATGATSVVGTNGATFYITGVQLEKGSTATSFDYRPYTNETQLCQRYYGVQEMWGQIASGGYGQGGGFTWFFKVSMRTTPTISFSNQTIGAGAATYGPQTVNGSGMGSGGNGNGQFQFTAIASAEL